MLLGALNYAAALGALRALKEGDRKLQYAVVGQNASFAAARTELLVAGSNLIGSVSFFPETYGKYLVKIARGLQGRPVPAANFVMHLLITAANVDDYYPNDTLKSCPNPDTLPWNYYH